MSFELPPIATIGPQRVVSAASPPKRVEPAAPVIADTGVIVDTVPLSPPPEVHAAIKVAASAHERLAARGHQLSFKLDEGTGTVHVEVHDLKGNVLFTAPPSKALEIASGGNID